MDLSEKCEDLQNRLRCNNVRIYLIPEGSEGHDTTGFVQELLQKTLKIPYKMDIKIERAHRTFRGRPKDLAAPANSIVVRFIEAAIKDKIIQQAWSQKQVFLKIKGSSLITATLLIYKGKEEKFTKLLNNLKEREYW